MSSASKRIYRNDLWNGFRNWNSRKKVKTEILVRAKNKGDNNNDQMCATSDSRIVTLALLTLIFALGVFNGTQLTGMISQTTGSFAFNPGNLWPACDTTQQPHSGHTLSLPKPSSPPRLETPVPSEWRLLGEQKGSRYLDIDEAFSGWVR